MHPNLSKLLVEPAFPTTEPPKRDPYSGSRQWLFTLAAFQEGLPLQLLPVDPRLADPAIGRGFLWLSAGRTLLPVHRSLIGQTETSIPGLYFHDFL